MDRKFISRLFINKSKDGSKVYLKGNITIKKEDLRGFINEVGDLVVPVFGHHKKDQTKTGQEYTAFTLEVIQDDQSFNQKTTQGSQKTTQKSNKDVGLDNLPF